jgi:hypothetical protein
MERGERLERFVGWVSTLGVDEARLGVVREIAGAMLQRAGDGPTTPAAVDAVVAEYTATPDGGRGIPFVRKVGELLLVFERAHPPEPARPPVTAVPSGVPSGELLAGFELAGEDVRDAEPRRSTGERAALAAGASAAARFRCPTCRIFVVPTASGTCPKCGRPPPRMLDLPPDQASPPGGGRSGGAGRVLGLVIAVVASAAGVWLGSHLASRACSKEEPSSAVEGPYEAHALGMRLDFERGWRRIETVESTEVAGMFTHQMMFFRGGSSADPEVGLLIGTGTPGWLPKGMLKDLTAAEFRVLVANSVQGMKRGARDGLELEPEACEVVQLGGRRVGRCAGHAESEGRRLLLVYIWVFDGKFALAMFFSRGEPDAARAEADRLVGSARPL